MNAHRVGYREVEPMTPEQIAQEVELRRKGFITVPAGFVPPIVDLNKRVVKKWVGFYLNSKGEVDMGFFDSNPGYLAHTYQVEIEVPREVYECLNRKLKCVVMGKFGPEATGCQSEVSDV